jgi:hypothetical protein
MDLMWIPVGLAAWFLVSVVIALCIGPVLKSCSLARESADQQRDERRTSPVWPITGAGTGEPVPNVPGARRPAATGQRAPYVLNRGAAQ